MEPMAEQNAANNTADLLSRFLTTYQDPPIVSTPLAEVVFKPTTTSRPKHDTPTIPPTTIRTTPRKSRNDDKNVDGTVVDVDEYIRFHSIQKCSAPTKPDGIVTNEVNVDSIIGGRPMLEEVRQTWRNAAREDKGMSVLDLGNSPLIKEVNVDSVLRLEVERPDLFTYQSSRRGMDSVFEVDVERDEYDDDDDDDVVAPPTQKKWGRGPPSMLEAEINVDSVIRLNQQETRKHRQLLDVHQYQQTMMKRREQDTTNETFQPDDDHDTSDSHGDHDIFGQVNVDSVIRINTEKGTTEKVQKPRRRSLFSKVFGKKIGT